MEIILWSYCNTAWLGHCGNVNLFLGKFKTKSRTKTTFSITFENNRRLTNFSGESSKSIQSSMQNLIRPVFFFH